MMAVDLILSLDNTPTKMKASINISGSRITGYGKTPREALTNLIDNLMQDHFFDDCYSPGVHWVIGETVEKNYSDFTMAHLRSK